MSLANKLNTMSDIAEIQRKEVEDEIVTYFKNIFESGRFEKVLERNIMPDETKSRTKSIDVEFWNYHSGCSDTYFRIYAFKWESPEGKHYKSMEYKGVYLRDISENVGRRLLSLAEYYLTDMVLGSYR